MFGEAAATSNSGAAGAGEVVAVGASDAFDDAELAQTGELSREGGGRALGEQRPEVGAALAGDVEAGTLQGREQALFDALKKLRPLRLRPLTGRGLGEPVECADAGREIVQTGEVFEITAVATEQDFTQVQEAVDRLSDGGEGAGCRALPMFHLEVMLESGDVVGGGLQAQWSAVAFYRRNWGSYLVNRLWRCSATRQTYIDTHMRCAGTTPASPIGRGAGTSLAASWPRLSSSPRAVRARRPHRDQSGAAGRACSRFVQSARHGESMDQGGQRCNQVDLLSCCTFAANAVRLQLHALAL